MATEQSTVTYKDVPGFPGYRVGDDGSVWTARRVYGSRPVQWRPMKQSPGTRGYLRVNLVPPDGGTVRMFRVHRLVLEAFVGPCPPGMECRHFPNADKTDNRLVNLSWGTPAENRGDNHATGAYQSGAAHPMAELTDAQVAEIRARHAAGGVLLRELAAEYGVTPSMLSFIVRYKSRKHDR